MREDFTTLVHSLLSNTTLSLNIQVVEKRRISSPTHLGIHQSSLFHLPIGNRGLPIPLNPCRSFLPSPHGYMRRVLSMVFVSLPLVTFVDINIIIQCEKQY